MAVKLFLCLTKNKCMCVGTYAYEAEANIGLKYQLWTCYAFFYGFEWTLPSFHWFSMIKQFSVREYMLYRDLYMMFLLCCSISIKWNEPLGKCKCVLFSFGKRMPLAVQICCFDVYVPVGVWDCCSILSVIKDLGRYVTSRMWGKNIYYN